jgi:hypothetical protein
VDSEGPAREDFATADRADCKHTATMTIGPARWHGKRTYVCIQPELSASWRSAAMRSANTFAIKGQRAF